MTIGSLSESQEAIDIMGKEIKESQIRGKMQLVFLLNNVVSNLNSNKEASCNL